MGVVGEYSRLLLARDRIDFGDSGEMNPLNRRQFLGAVAAGAAALSPLRSLAAETPQGSAARKIKIGLIGVGWYGMVNARAAYKAGGVEVVAVCDVDRAHLEKSAEEIATTQGSRPQTFKLYEELLAMPGLEAVIISTPTQWHALPFIAALKRGLHVYCEKPLSYDVREGQAMVAAAERNPRQVVQIGFQRRQSEAFRAVKTFIAEGNLGRVVQAEAQINFTAGLKNPAPEQPPESLDWDMWCGPGALIPYSQQVGHLSWRLEETSGQGHLFDWGIHLIDASRVILGQGAPQTVAATGGLYQLGGRITTPDTMTAHFEFERCPISWRHRLWGAEEYSPDINNGITFFGEKGSVWVSDNKWIHIPKGKGAERQVTEFKTDAGTLHMAEFLNGIREGKQGSCTTADAHLTTTTVKLGMIALKVGSKLIWDAKKQEVVSNAEASRHLIRPYRAPWKHPYLT